MTDNVGHSLSQLVDLGYHSEDKTGSRADKCDCQRTFMDTNTQFYNLRSPNIMFSHPPFFEGLKKKKPNLCSGDNLHYEAHLSHRADFAPLVL